MRAKSSKYRNGKEVMVTRKTMEDCKDTFLKDGTFWEGESIEQFFSFVKDGDSVLDIGSQAGSYSLYAKFLPKSRFFAFEPNPGNRIELIENLKLNSIDNVFVHDCALSDYDGKGTLNVSYEHAGLHTLGKPIRFTKGGKFDVSVKKLDSLITFAENLHMKIDTEGSELMILKGAEELIRKCKPRIFLEWNTTNMEQCGYEEEELKEYLEYLGYEYSFSSGENQMWISSPIEHQKVRINA